MTVCVFYSMMIRRENKGTHKVILNGSSSTFFFCHTPVVLGLFWRTPPPPTPGLPVRDRFSGLLKGTQAPKTEEREKFARILKETHWPLSPSTSERTQGVACCLVPGGGQGPEAGLLLLFLLLVCDCSCLCWFLDHLYKNSKTSENGKFFCFSGASKLHSDLLPRHLGALYTL